MLLLAMRATATACPMLRHALPNSSAAAEDTQQCKHKHGKLINGPAHPQPAAGRRHRRQADLGDPPAAVQPQHLQVRSAGRQRRHPRVRHPGAPAR